MHTDEGEVIHVEANSLADFAGGKRLFADFSEQITRTGGIKYAQLISMGVIEGGTESGQPSCMFLITTENDPEQYFVFETAAKSLRQLATAVTKAQAYFESQTGDEQ